LLCGALIITAEFGLKFDQVFVLPISCSFVGLSDDGCLLPDGIYALTYHLGQNKSSPSGP
jgi:hypothetical protein